jgi:hypothetical protein
LYIAVQVWLAHYAETTARLIVSTNKEGNGGPIRVMRLEQLASVFGATDAVIRILRLVGPPEHHAQLASFFPKSLYFACIIATGNFIVVMMRAVLAETDGREPSARERHVAELFSVVVCGVVVAASTVGVWLVNLVVLTSGTITLAVVRWHVVKMADLLRYAGAGRRENDNLESAVRRTKRLANMASLYVVLFAGSRIGLILMNDVAISPAQGYSASYYWLNVFFADLAWYSTAFIASETVRYAGGPAYLASQKGRISVTGRRYFAAKSCKVSSCDPSSNATSVVVRIHSRNLDS